MEISEEEGWNNLSYDEMIDDLIELVLDGRINMTIKNEQVVFSTE